MTCSPKRFSSPVARRNFVRTTSALRSILSISARVSSISAVYLGSALRFAGRLTAQMDENRRDEHPAGQWVGAAMTPFSISGIAREKCEFVNGAFSWRWTIGVNWPEGALSFESSGFTQTLRGPIVSTSEQLLDPKQRPATG